MTVDVEVHRSVAAEGVPDDDALRRAAAAAYRQALDDGHGFAEPRSMVIAVVDAETSEALNSQWRGRHTPTNVLAFPAPPATPSPGVEAEEPPSAGDIVICADVVAREAAEQGKPLTDHWLHMVVHGALHLMGYDHMSDEEAETMESLERAALAGLGVADPYAVRVA